MKTSTACPKCSGQITLWHGLRAPTPFRIRCVRCRAKLRVRLPGLTAAFAMICLLALVLGGYLGCLIVMRRWTEAGVLGVAVLAGWLAFELVGGMVLFTYARFTVVDPKTEAMQKTQPVFSRAKE
ncbi:MAG: hypothetical protein JWR69_1876 [Pedosphaera sp.]|nr:hypothetical protein [Pedosphaera sp.]